MTSVYETHVDPLHTALTQRFPDLGIMVKVRDYQHIGGVSFTWNDKRYYTETPDTVDWRANDFRWWLHKFTDIIARKTGQ